MRNTKATQIGLRGLLSCEIRVREGQRSGKVNKKVEVTRVTKSSKHSAMSIQLINVILVQREKAPAAARKGFARSRTVAEAAGYLRPRLQRPWHFARGLHTPSIWK